ncbi:Threonine/homoserine/homoserine lactone efflux protein [Faunimonas pinastri]|uniref:Threonine/homoserine/homoserine lactone efflux protein n=1 Tax=Faunimonas pinastri TaxID=1855383 RepID=A0A1H9FTD7_9HYPH|nr:LysE family translocator [Faunimonas pinastri]SEQ41202.1 Threonine/homoserine/homoserine lactone efflux protein [Faunimonas pinastri]
MSLSQMLAFLLFAAVATVTPGPNNVMLTATGANFGIRRGLPHLLGIAIGFALMIFIVALGLGSLLIQSPTLLRALKIAGIVVLLWLSWKIATAGRSKTSDRANPVTFLEAALFQWVNPKAWLICASAVGTYLDAHPGSAATQATAFAVIFAGTALPCAGIWLLFGAGLQTWLRSERALRAFNIAMGVLLASTLVLLV